MEIEWRWSVLALALGMTLPAPAPRAAQERTAAREAPGDIIASLWGVRQGRVIFPDGRSFLVEVASTPAARVRGLMHRDRLDPDRGMIFLFEQAGMHSFWMKNTRIPLDIIWLDGEGRVVHLERSVPPCRSDPCPTVTPPGPAAWVLEVLAGQADGLQPGGRLAVRAEPAPPSRPPARP